MIIPERLDERIAFAIQHAATWGAAPATVGLDPLDITELATLATATSSKRSGAVGARSTAYAATLDQNASDEAMTKKLSALIMQIKGFAANAVTGVIVIAASRLGVPVSTTHVSCGSLFGIGLKTRQADSPVIRHVVMSWVLTLPIAALLAAGISRVL